MKRVLYPPMIIFLDVLFVFLFLLILNNNKSAIEIELESGKLIDNAKVIYKLKDNYYTLDNQEYIPSSNRDFIYTDECPNNIDECRYAYHKHGKDIFIVYSQQLQAKISHLSILALGNNTCKQIKFFIKREGIIDNKKMLKENNCLRKIKGYEENFIN